MTSYWMLTVISASIRDQSDPTVYQIKPHASAFPPPLLPSLFDPVLLSSSSSEYKVNAVLLLGPSQPRKESTTQTLTTNYKITPTLPWLCSVSPTLCLSKLINTPASILQKRHFAVTAVLFVFWAAGLQVISRPSDIHWQTSVRLTLQSLQFSKVTYGMRRTHPPCLLLSAFMMLDSRRGPSHLRLSPPLLREQGTFSVSHNPITPLRPLGGAIRAARHRARGVVLSFL